MSKFKPFLTIAIVAIVVIAIVSRVAALRKIVFNAQA
jgi:hypothetical protein